MAAISDPGADGRPLERKYARIERERRFLLERLPDAVDLQSFVRLRDRFVEGAFLRIRCVERPDGSEVLTKLGQKLEDPEAPGDSRRRRMTTIYLAAGQSRVLEPLDGPRAVKRRYTLEEQGRTWAIDVWEKPASAAGLILAEIECETDAELDAIARPAWAVREVTDDGNYSAYHLARLSRGEDQDLESSSRI